VEIGRGSRPDDDHKHTTDNPPGAAVVLLDRHASERHGLSTCLPVGQPSRLERSSAPQPPDAPSVSIEARTRRHDRSYVEGTIGTIRNRCRSGTEAMTTSDNLHRVVQGPFEIVASP
jgi:hypothetical protein